MHLTMLGNYLYFTANGNLWRSDGTTTVIITDSIDEQIYGGSNLTKVGNTLYFTASTTTSGSGIWKSNGTPAGTVRVKGIDNSLEIQPDDYAVYADKFVNSGSTIYAIVTNESGNRQLWETDGSELNTKPIRYDENNIVSNASNLAVVGNTLYFSGHNNESGRELWKYAGVGYAELVVDIAAGVSDSMPRKITCLGR